MGMLRHIDRERVEKAVSLMADPANRPVFVHCLRGQDRTGVVVAAYRMEVDGWALPEAEKEMQAYGFNNIWVNLKQLIHKLAADLGKTK
jgi:tyrosine-protein phosphatase SIW14